VKVVEHVYDDGMLEGLAQAIDELELPVDGAALIEAIALRDRLGARISAAVDAFNVAQLCSATGITTSSTGPAGTPNSSPTPPSKSPDPTAPPSPPTHPAEDPAVHDMFRAGAEPRSLDLGTDGPG
jgi:hypothetical protein